MAGRQQYVGASTKAYLGYAATLEWLGGVRDAVTARPALAEHGVVPFVIPSFPALAAAVSILDGTGVVVGAQNVAWGGGALTGEVPAPMLAELGVQLVEIGHAERRRLFAETNTLIERKHSAAREAGLNSLLCVGEPTRRRPDAAADYCFAQVAAVVAKHPEGTLLIAYEPVWAIGAEEPAEPDFVIQVVEELRKRLATAFPLLRPSIVYWGSAGPGLIQQLEGVDGLFLGRFAHDVANFGTVLDEAMARSASDVAGDDQV
jgi:triosephosphate isomerase